MLISIHRLLLRWLAFSAFFVISATLTSGSAHGFGKKPVVVPPPTPPSTPPAPPPVDVIRARWDSKQPTAGPIWSKHVYDSIPTIAPNLLAKNPGDIAQFCPAYASLSTADKKNFWVYLLSAMTELESNHNPAVTYTEKFTDNNGEFIVSRGLLQISIESANGYGCGFSNAQEIHEPLKNLTCGLRILNRFLGKDTQLAGKSLTTGSWLGGARYWAVLRAPKVTTIQGWTKALRMCAQ